MQEAVAAGIRMIVTPTEGMPVHDALKAKRLTQDAGVTVFDTLNAMVEGVAARLR